VGNNSCGSNSVVYRSTREHLLEIKALLSDGSEAIFGALSLDEFHAKCELEGLEGSIYRSTRTMLGNYENQVEIRKEFPKKSVERRNTGYAIDVLLESAPFTAGEADFNFCKLIAGSEGTLAFITEIKLNVVQQPPKEIGLLCVHFNSIDESLRANLIALQYGPSASELIDHYILECTKDNIEQSKNRFLFKVIQEPSWSLNLPKKPEKRYNHWPNLLKKTCELPVWVIIFLCYLVQTPRKSGL